MMIRSTIVFAILAISPFVATAEDWKKIARETDEPAFGHQVSHIIPGSQAERIGLEVGDFVVQIDEQQVRGFGLRNFDIERAFFFVPQGGKSESVNVKSGKVGYHMQEIFRPWVAYLRGEIGTPSEDWEDAVADALLKLHDQPEAAENAWNAVRESGYPADELDAFVKAYLAWRKNEPIPVKEAFEKVYDEFEIMPALYFAKLEDMATASGQISILRKLRELDPESSNVSERLMGVWEKIEIKDDLEPTNLLAIAESRRGEEFSAKLGRYKTEKSSPRAMTTNPVLGKVMSATPGHYQYYRGEVPEGIKNLHYRFVTHAAATGFHDRWLSRIRIDIFATDKKEWKEYGSSLLGRVGIGENRYGGSYVYAEGGHRAYRRSNDVGFQNGLSIAAEKKTIREVDFSADPVQLDIIYLDDQIAVYCNGICYVHLPCGKGITKLGLGLHVCGMTSYLKSFQVWELDSAE